MLEAIKGLLDHLPWADECLLTALEVGAPPPAEALREYAHILGADEIWLARLEGRPSTAAVWPTMGPAELRSFAADVHAGFAQYLATLTPELLAGDVTYSTTDGRTYTTPAREILLHVAMHAHYHRGKVNLLLRQAGLAPAPVDFIAFVRGAPAAVTGDPGRVLPEP